MVTWTAEQLREHVTKTGKKSGVKAGNEFYPSPLLAMPGTTDEQRLNKTERAWLEVVRSRPHEWLGIQNLTLKLADDTRYTPDIIVKYADGLPVVYEVKGGHIWDDAKVKLKVAAREFRWLTFVLVQRYKIGQAFKEEVVKP
jgi:hypothetical protein